MKLEEAKEPKVKEVKYTCEDHELEFYTRDKWYKHRKEFHPESIKKSDRKAGDPYECKEHYFNFYYIRQSPVI